MKFSPIEMSNNSSDQGSIRQRYTILLILLIDRAWIFQRFLEENLALEDSFQGKKPVNLRLQQLRPSTKTATAQQFNYSTGNPRESGITEVCREIREH